MWSKWSDPRVFIKSAPPGRPCQVYKLIFCLPAAIWTNFMCHILPASVQLLSDKWQDQKTKVGSDESHLRRTTGVSGSSPLHIRLFNQEFDPNFSPDENKNVSNCVQDIWKKSVKIVWKVCTVHCTLYSAAVAIGSVRPGLLSPAPWLSQVKLHHFVLNFRFVKTFVRNVWKWHLRQSKTRSPFPGILMLT